MPSISSPSLRHLEPRIDHVIHSIQPRQSPGTAVGVPSPPLAPPGPTHDGPPFRGGSSREEDRNGLSLSPGLVAALVLSILAFFVLVTGLCAYWDRRRRLKEAKAIEAARQSRANGSVARSSMAGAVTVEEPPPPPYERVHRASRHPAAVHQWDRPRDAGYAEGAIELHPVVANGLEDGRGDRR